MDQREIEVGRLYAVREPARPGVEMQKVKVLERVRSGRWKVEWVEPNPGLVDYVRSANIICRWADRRPVVRDEENDQRLRSASDDLWPGDEHPLSHAVDQVLYSTGEPSIGLVHGLLVETPDVIERICARAGVEVADLPDHHLSFMDRHGSLHLSFGAALHLARAFAAAEPGTVLLHVDTAERQYVNEASEPFNSHLLPLVEQWRAGWALVRQWAGTDAQLARLNEEIDRLRQVIQRTIWDLRTAGHAELAATIDRRLRGGLTARAALPDGLCSRGLRSSSCRSATGSPSSRTSGQPRATRRASTRT